MTTAIRFQRFPVRAVQRSITPRRLSASKRALQRQRNKLPLFSDQVASQQPTPLARLERIDLAGKAYWIRLRKDECQRWVQVRRAVREASCTDFRQSFLKQWNRASHPGSAVYALDFLHSLRRKMCACCPNVIAEGNDINCIYRTTED